MRPNPRSHPPRSPTLLVPGPTSRGYCRLSSQQEPTPQRRRPPRQALRLRQIARHPREAPKLPPPSARTPRGPRLKRRRARKRRCPGELPARSSPKTCSSSCPSSVAIFWINGNWGMRSQLAVDRFNRLAKLDLPLEEPQRGSLDALKDLEGSALLDRAGCAAAPQAAPGRRRSKEASRSGAQGGGRSERSYDRGRAAAATPAARERRAA
jgi:hypothetical protein